MYIRLIAVFLLSPISICLFSYVCATKSRNLKRTKWLDASKSIVWQGGRKWGIGIVVFYLFNSLYSFSGQLNVSVLTILLCIFIVITPKTWIHILCSLNKPTVTDLACNGFLGQSRCFRNLMSSSVQNRYSCYSSEIRVRWYFCYFVWFYFVL